MADAKRVQIGDQSLGIGESKIPGKLKPVGCADLSHVVDHDGTPSHPADRASASNTAPGRPSVSSAMSAFQDTSVGSGVYFASSLFNARSMDRHPSFLNWHGPSNATTTHTFPLDDCQVNSIARSSRAR